MSTAHELKPCRRCGHEVSIVKVKGYPMLACPACGCYLEARDHATLVQTWNDRPLEDQLRAELDSARAEAARLRSAAEAAIAALGEWRCENCGWMIGEGNDEDPDAGPCDSCTATENAYRGLVAALTHAATGREEGDE